MSTLFIYFQCKWHRPLQLVVRFLHLAPAFVVPEHWTVVQPLPDFGVGPREFPELPLIEGKQILQGVLPISTASFFGYLLYWMIAGL